MKKTVKVYYDQKDKKVKVDKKGETGGPDVKVDDNGNVTIISNGETVVVPMDIWNHGSGWNSMTLEWE